jgi:hypothetical protein
MVMRPSAAIDVPSDGGRRLRRLAFAQATVVLMPADGLCAAAVRPLGPLRGPQVSAADAR